VLPSIVALILSAMWITPYLSLFILFYT